MDGRPQDLCTSVAVLRLDDCSVYDIDRRLYRSSTNLYRIKLMVTQRGESHALLHRLSGDQFTDSTGAYSAITSNQVRWWSSVFNNALDD